MQASAAGGALLGLGDLGFLSRLRPVSADEATLDPKVVRLQPEIEPLVRLLEETPRERLLEEVAARMQKGPSYRDVLAALLLAGVRNVQPRPSVGLKFHAVLVVNSAHLASLGSPDTDRWLPIFWALDYFKSSQAQDVREGNWTMGPVDESAVPPARKAREAFIDGDGRLGRGGGRRGRRRPGPHGRGQRGLRAVLPLRRPRLPRRSATRRSTWPIAGGRSSASAGSTPSRSCGRWPTPCCMHEGGNPAQRDDPADRPWQRNQERAARIKEDWTAGKPDAAASADLLATLRTGSDDDACEQVVELLNRGVAPQSVWDALFDGAGELLLRQPGIVSLHAVTSTNALHFAYQASGDDQTRRLLLLQNAAFLTLFREAMGGRGKVGDARIDQLEPIATVGGRHRGPSRRSSPRRAATGRPPPARRWPTCRPGTTREPLIDAARRLVFLKGNDAHDYKFSSAVLEDYYHASPAWRERYLASSLLLLPGSADRDNDLVRRTRAALNA